MVCISEWSVHVCQCSWPKLTTLGEVSPGNVPEGVNAGRPAIDEFLSIVDLIYLHLLSKSVVR